MMCAEAHWGKHRVMSCLHDTSYRRGDTSWANTSLRLDINIARFILILGDIMKDDKLAELSMRFAVSIIDLVKRLKGQHESVISNQIGRSGTSIGANIREANYAHSKADFIVKLEIALKEANETGYWLELLFKTQYITDSEYKELDAICTNIRVLLISSCKTAKENRVTKSAR